MVELSLQSRVIESLKPADELTRRKRVESVIHAFHAFILAEAAQAEAAAKAGILQVQPPDVYSKVVMPNITAFQPDDEEDPAIYVLEAAQSLYFMATNTLLLAAQAMATRGPSHGPVAQHLQHFAAMSNENMGKLVAILFTDVNQSKIVDANGKLIH